MDRFLLDRLRRLSPFASVQPRMLERIASGAVVRTFRRGEVLCRAGDPVDRVHLVARGLVQVALTTPAGRRMGLELIGPGQAAGLLCVLDDGPSPHEVRGLSDGLTIALPCRAIRDEVERSPP